MWDLNIHRTQIPIKLLLLYLWLDNYFITSNWKLGVCSMEIITPHFRLGRLLKVRITWIALGLHNSNNFKYCIIIYVYHICSCCTPIVYSIEINAVNDNNKEVECLLWSDNLERSKKLKKRVVKIWSKEASKAAA